MTLAYEVTPRRAETDDPRVLRRQLLLARLARLAGRASPAHPHRLPCLERPPVAPPPAPRVARPPIALQAAQPGLVIPEQFGLLSAKCPRCRGPLAAEDGEIACLLCTRRFLPTRVSPGGKLLAVRLAASRPGKLSRAGQLQEQRTRRALGRAQGTNGRAARILTVLPSPPEHLSVSRVAKKLALPNSVVRETLEELAGFGYVCRVLYRRGAVPRKQEFVGYARRLPEAPS